MTELPIAAVDRIIRKSSGLRVSETAAKELAVHLEDVGMKISQEASLYAKHAGRKTVTDEDIRLVLKKWISLLVINLKKTFFGFFLFKTFLFYKNHF